MIQLINAFSGNVSEIKPKVGNSLTLDEYYQHIGNGCDVIERIQLADGRAMYLDGEGKFRKVQFINNPATILLHKAGGMLDDFVVGNAIIVDPENEEEDPAG